MDFSKAFYALMADEGLWHLEHDPRDPGGFEPGKILSAASAAKTIPAGMAGRSSTKRKRTASV